MKKTFIIIVSIAIFGIGTTMFVSCSKEENEVLTSNVETKIGDPELTIPGDVPDTVAIGTVFWWFEKIIKEEEGHLIFVKKCLPFLHYEKSKICKIRIQPNKGIPTEGDVAADLDGKDGFVLRLKLTISETNAELYESFKILADEGVIEFEDDIEIEDPENLLSLKESYIPAGTYPIKFIDDKFVITINE